MSVQIQTTVTIWISIGETKKQVTEEEAIALRNDLITAFPLDKTPMIIPEKESGDLWVETSIGYWHKESGRRVSKESVNLMLRTLERLGGRQLVKTIVHESGKTSSTVRPALGLCRDKKWVTAVRIRGAGSSLQWKLSKNNPLQKKREEVPVSDVVLPENRPDLSSLQDDRQKRIQAMREK